MKIQLKENCHQNYSGNYAEKIEAVEGQWLEIDTEFLFKEQLNTKPIPEVSAAGLRIYQQDVDKIEDDERIGRAKCDYCGAWTDAGDPCVSCSHGTQYMKEFFPGTKRVAKTVEEEVDGLLGDAFQVVK